MDDRLWNIVDTFGKGEHPQALWYGRPVASYTKEELVDIVIFMGKMIEEQSNRQIHDMEMLSLLRRR
jgi:hypothetical protein